MESHISKKSKLNSEKVLKHLKVTLLTFLILCEFIRDFRHPFFYIIPDLHLELDLKHFPLTCPGAFVHLY